MSDDAHSREKLAVTAEMLATGSGRIQDRLRDAYISGLGRLKAEDIRVGDEAIALLEQINVAMTKLYAPETGSVAATAAAMDDPTAVTIDLPSATYERLLRSACGGSGDGGRILGARSALPPSSPARQ